MVEEGFVEQERVSVAGPFTALSAAGGIRPDVYVGWDGTMNDCWLSGPFTGLIAAVTVAR